MNVAHQSIQYTQRKKVQSKHVLAVLAAPKARRCLDSQIPIDPIGTYWNILEPDSERMSPFSAPRRWSSPMFHIPHSTSFDILRHPSTTHQQKHQSKRDLPGFCSFGTGYARCICSSWWSSPVLASFAILLSSNFSLF